jgi:hypothetical protein
MLEREEDTNLRTTTIGDSVFKNRPRPFHNMRPDAMTEAKLRTWSRSYRRNGKRATEEKSVL